ncbi:MAG TPA: hypothetical protein VK154_14595 [Chitinophagales bacterium]|nr:hypothetical protein [Chitinophagales bacterium]
MNELYFFIKENPTVAVSITAIIFTFLGTVATLFVTSWNVNRQLKMQISTTVNKEWIKDVRSFSANIIHQSGMVLAYNKRKKPEEISKSDEAVIDISLNYSTLLTLLDSKNEDHQLLAFAVKDVIAFVQGGAADGGEFQKKMQTVLAAVQNISNNLR